ncbi:hypothetical protein EXIGLDRAFT_723515, partial [Exidia glandulosa HHB12029]
LDDAPLAKILPGHIAWHSSHMAVPAAKLAAAAKGIQPTVAKTSMVLNIDGSVLLAGERVKADYLAEQMTGPLRVASCVPGDRHLDRAQREVHPSPARAPVRPYWQELPADA